MTAKRDIKRKPRSDAFDAIHSAASALHRAEVIDKTTLREFDDVCLVPVPAYKGQDVKRIRTEIAKVSQPIFAVYLNTSVSTVQKWERNSRPVQGPAVRLLNLIERTGSLQAIL